MLHRLVSVVLLASVLAGCNDEAAVEPSAEMSSSALESRESQTPEDDSSVSAAEGLLSRAELALGDDRLFEPAEANALALYVQALSAAEGEQSKTPQGRRLTDAMAGDRQQQIRLALADLFPLGLVYAERAAEERRYEDATRVLALLALAQPGSSSVARLQAATEASLNPTTSADAQVTSPSISSAVSKAQPTTVEAPRELPARTATLPFNSAGGGESRRVATAVDESTLSSELAIEGSAASPRTVSLSAPSDAAAAAPAASGPRAGAAAKVAETPIVLSRVSPRYPPRALRQRIEGWVLVSFTINTEREVRNVRVIAAEPEGVFEREAVGSMERWRFESPEQEINAQRRIEFTLGS